MTDTPQPKKRRWVMPLLGASLIANMLVVGIVLGAFFANRDGPPRDKVDGPARSLVGAPFLRALAPEQRRALYGEVRKNGDRLRENRTDLRQQFEALLAAIQAEPFDAEMVQALLQKQRDVALRRQSIGESLLIAQLSQMKVEERVAYAERLSRDLRRLRRD